MYTENEIALIWLDSFSLGHKKVGQLLSLFPNTADIFKKFETKKTLLVDILGETIYTNMKRSINESYITKQLLLLEKYKITAVTFDSPTYPGQLREIANPPLILYCKGDIPLLKHKMLISVVGTRRPTRYGRDMAKWFSSELVQNGFVIVSGLAFGIDSEASTSALESCGKTIAVLAGGLDEIYPAPNTALAARIEEKGLLVSEYKPHSKPTVYTFPERNRIISGLSSGTVIIEAGEGSGSLITANFAIEQNKELFIIPSNLNSVQGKGSNRLINEIPHSFVTSPDDVLGFFNVENKSSKESNSYQLSMEEQLIYDALFEGELHFDELQEKTEISVQNLNRLLTTLEISGIIKKLTGNYFSR